MKILVTGGAGYIGSHAVHELIKAGHQVVVLDNLSNGHAESVHPRAEFIVGSTAETLNLISRFKDLRIDAIMHFAANIEVAESVTDPYKYYQNNLANSLQLLQAANKCGVRKFIFSSTAAVYGNPVKTPITEDQQRLPINPYGRSKLMMEMILDDFAQAYNIDYTILRYFNVAGASPDSSIGEDHHPESHLIPRILKGAGSNDHEVRIFGTDYPTPDGSCIRDYVHVIDLVRAHILALEGMTPGTREVYNIGSEKGFSVKEVIQVCEHVSKQKLNVQEYPRRAGDPAILVASNAKIKTQLKWTPLYPDLETIIEHAWKWHSTHPQGYRSGQPLSPLRKSLQHELNESNFRNH